MALVGDELETLVSKPDALTTRLPPCAQLNAIAFLGNTLNANIPTSGGAAQLIRAQVGNRKVVSSRFDFRNGQCIVASLEKTLRTCNPKTRPKHLSIALVAQSDWRYISHQASGWWGRQTIYVEVVNRAKHLTSGSYKTNEINFVNQFVNKETFLWESVIRLHQDFFL